MAGQVCHSVYYPESRCLLATGEPRGLAAAWRGFAGSVEMLAVPYCVPSERSGQQRCGRRLRQRQCSSNRPAMASGWYTDTAGSSLRWHRVFVLEGWGYTELAVQDAVCMAVEIVPAVRSSRLA